MKSKEYLLDLFNEATLTYKTTFTSTIKVNLKKRTRSTKQSSK